MADHGTLGQTQVCQQRLAQLGDVTGDTRGGQGSCMSQHISTCGPGRVGYNSTGCTVNGPPAGEHNISW